jgi:ribonucleoside-diphosphate reductase alpha chain
MSEVKKRPEILNGETHKISTGCGSLYVTLNFDENQKPFEIFAKLGKSGGCSACNTEALTRAISIGLRAGVPLDEYYDHMRDIQCISPTVSGGEQIKSCPDAIAKVMKCFIKEDE